MLEDNEPAARLARIFDEMRPVGLAGQRREAENRCGRKKDRSDGAGESGHYAIPAKLPTAQK